MYNLQGDVIGLADAATGKVIAKYLYDAWGKIVSVKNASGYTIGTANPFRYRGYYYDTETGFYYLNSRYYNPEVGRFLNLDSRINGGLLGCNLFAYCENNPTNCIDKYGKDSSLALQSWIYGMGWLPFADTVLPIGDIVYAGGVLILGLLTLGASQDYKDRPSIIREGLDVGYGTPPSGNGDDDDDDYYDNDDNFAGKTKVGSSKGKTPGNNQKQNKQFLDATKGLTMEQKRIVHRIVSKKVWGIMKSWKLLRIYSFVK